jgi:hypothetical protein
MNAQKPALEILPLKRLASAHTITLCKLNYTRRVVIGQVLIFSFSGIICFAMKHTAPSARPFLPAFLIMLVVFFMIFMALRILYPPAAISRPTSTLRPSTATITRTPVKTATYTATLTITRTPRPTWTLRPTATRTITPTPAPTDTPLPPIMPTWVKPVQYNDLYQLRPWSPEDANSVIELLQAYPDTLYPTPADRETSTYNAAFTYVAFLQREALLRYPDAPQAEQWRWGLAYNLAHTNDPGVPEAYALLILDALDRQRIPLEDLPVWFNQHEHNFSLSIHRFLPPPGYLNRLLLEIKTKGGAAYLWLVESPQKIELFPLTSYFDFAHAIEIHFTAGDLTGDGIEELVIYADPTPGKTIPGLPQVFSLEAGNPPQISFAPELPFDLGTNYQFKWVIDQGTLRSIVTIYPACAVQIIHTYFWDGSQLIPNPLVYQIEPNPTQLGYCEGVIDHIASQWGAEVVIPMMEALLPVWPPMTDLAGKPYPADAQDEWRYRLGVYHALSAHFEQAQQTLTDLITHPTATDSRWIAAAEQFLQAYASPSDLYSACLAAQFCDPRQAMQQLLIGGKFDDIGIAIDALIRGGVTVRSSGNFDFDNDGELERWVLLRHHPLERLEFWVLARWESGISALFIEQVDSTETRPYFHEPLDSPPIAQIGPKRGFVLARLPGTRQPYLITKEIAFIPTTFTLDALQSIIDDLFAGTSPAIIRDRLEDLEQSDEFNCLNYHICDRFYYTLGLAYELAGDIRSAIDTYVKLWWENSDSPYMLIARLKLKQLPYKSPIPSPIPTLTPSITRTPGPSATPSITPTTNPNATATITPTTDPNATPSITPTNTSTPTESPTPTETLTPTT